MLSPFNNRSMVHCYYLLTMKHTGLFLVFYVENKDCSSARFVAYGILPKSLTKPHFFFIIHFSNYFKYILWTGKKEKKEKVLSFLNILFYLNEKKLTKIQLYNIFIVDSMHIILNLCVNQKIEAILEGRQAHLSDLL